MATMAPTLNNQTMKAIVSAKPGPVSGLRVEDIDRPALADDGVLVRVRASSANPVDLFPTTFAGNLMGGRKAAVLGTDFAGVVEEVGKNVTRFQPGDEVFGGARGAFAEYVAAGESTPMALKPKNVSFEAAGTVGVAGTTALQAIRTHGGLQSGQRVLINGASGGVGTFAVQIARAMGGGVTAVCSTRNVELVRSLGADRVIDYSKEDFTRGRDAYDLIIDVAAGHSFGAFKRVLSPEGTYVAVGAAAVQHGRAGAFRAIGHLLGIRVRAMAGNHRVRVFIASLNNVDCELLAKLLESGEVVPAIDRRYGLESISEALEYMNTGHARAKIAIQINAG